MISTRRFWLEQWALDQHNWFTVSDAQEAFLLTWGPKTISHRYARRVLNRLVKKKRLNKYTEKSIRTKQ